ncbi:MAG: CBS domain-containing protein [Nitrososphaeraceae archaeon]|jgi:CBS domain-containing protein
MVATTVRHVIRKKLETIGPSSTAQEAAKRMRSKKISSLVVIERGDAPVGIVTERDLVRQVCSKDISSDSVLIQEIMSSPIVTIDVNASIEQAADKMIQNKVRHLLIVEDGRIYGIITPSDFTIYLTENLNMDEVNARILQSLKEDIEFH